MEEELDEYEELDQAIGLVVSVFGPMRSLKDGTVYRPPEKPQDYGPQEMPE